MKLVFCGYGTFEPPEGLLKRSYGYVRNIKNHRLYGIQYVYKISELIDLENNQIINIWNSDVSIEKLFFRKEEIFDANPDVLTIFIGAKEVKDNILVSDENKFEKSLDTFIKEIKRILPKVTIILFEPICIPKCLSGFDICNGLYNRRYVMMENGQYKLERFVKLYAEKIKQVAQNNEIHFLPLQKEFDKNTIKGVYNDFMDNEINLSYKGSEFVAKKWIELFHKIII